MDEFKFVLKTLLATFILVLLMQIRVGGKSMESWTYGILAQSGVAHFVNDVAHGTVTLGRQVKDRIQEQFRKMKEPSLP